MSDRSRAHADDLRGLVKLAVTATTEVTNVVQATQGAIGGWPARILSAPTYAAIRGVTGVVGGALDFALARLAPVIGAGSAGPERELVVAALNGVIGDYLAETKNPLAIEMRLHRDDAARVTPKIIVFVHGSSMNRLAWRAARDLGFTPLHLDYNSGLHISTNGRAFAAMLEELVTTWPVPVEEVAIVAHSMGGLVTRSACHYGGHHAWRAALRTIVFVGTPHHGAPLERAGNWLQAVLGVTPWTRPLAPLARLRSAGVTDLRFGNIIDEHWHARDRFELGVDTRTPVPLPPGVACYAVAAEKDLLVPLASAMGDHADPRAALQVPAERRFVAKGASHIGVLEVPEVWERIRGWLARESTGAGSPPTW